MVFKPLNDRTRWEGLAVISWIVLIDLLLVRWLLRKPVDWSSFALLLVIVATVPVLAHLAYRTWGAFTLEYWLDRDALRIRWAATCQVIPLSAIQRIVEGADEFGSITLGLQWPAPFVHRVIGPKGAPLERFASAPLEECLLLETDDGLFAISPVYAGRFLEALQEHHRLGPAHGLEPARQRPRLCGEMRLDAVGRGLLVAGTLGCLLLLGILMVRYPSLSETLVFHYNSLGAPDSVRPKRALFLLPVIGVTAFLFNGAGGLWMACRRQPTGAYLLWAGTLIVQSLSLLALVSMIV